MKVLKQICFYLSAILCIVCFLFPDIGKADTRISLTIELTADGAALSGAEFRLYRLGSHLNDAGEPELDEPYASHFTITIENVTDWDELAEEVAAFIEAEGVPYTDASVTDGAGKAVFPSSGELNEGLYFVSSATVQRDNKTYTTLPFIILLPAWDPESGSWLSHVTAQPKIGVEEPAPTPTATPTETPTANPSATPDTTAAPSPTQPSPPPSPGPTPLPGTGVEWRPTFWFSGLGVFFFLLSIVTGIIAFRKGKEDK